MSVVLQEKISDLMDTYEAKEIVETVIVELRKYVGNARPGQQRTISSINADVLEHAMGKMVR